MSENQSFWSTVPGILTGIAAVVTAVGGLLAVLSQTGVLGSKGDQELPDNEVVIEEGVTSGPESNGQTESVSTDSTAAGREIASITKKSAASAPESGTVKVNLLSSENGGQVLAATSDTWIKTIDGDERDFYFLESNVGGKTEAVYAFKDEKPAEFDTFTVLILDARDGNIKDFELLWGNESVRGKFHLIGKYQTQNMKLFKTPYQEFKFSPVTAKYLKVRLLSTWKYALIDAREFQLWGTLQ